MLSTTHHALCVTEGICNDIRLIGYQLYIQEHQHQSTECVLCDPHDKVRSFPCPYLNFWFFSWIVGLFLWFCKYWNCRSQWPLGLWLRPAAARLLRFWVRIPPKARNSVCCECCVLSGRGLCEELISRPEDSYRLRCVVVCDLETLRMSRPWPSLGRSATGRKYHWMFNLLAPKLFFNLTHPVYKMRIIQEPNKLESWNKLHFEEKKTESIYHI